MKVSLRWIFDHIEDDYRSIHVPDLVGRFNTAVAEIESYENVTCYTSDLQLAQVISVSENGILVHCPETNSEYSLSERLVMPEAWYFVIATGTHARWATLEDLGAKKAGHLGRVHPLDILKTGLFRAQAEADDWILEVDNKSINHRPDLWGHRGIAREVAALFGFRLKSLDQCVKKVDFVVADQQYPIQLQVQDDRVCDRFALQFFPTIENRPILFSIASRLARVGVRPHSSLVDLTNYVMMDLGQPMHVFDADAVGSDTMYVRRAAPKEELSLLDGSSITLTPEDTVVATKNRSLALAGIMGGADSAVTTETTSVLVESAHFNPAAIRAASRRHRIRTDASARFEKNIDPNQNTEAIERFNQLLVQLGIHHIAEPTALSFGAKLSPKSIIIQHEEIEGALGVSLEPKFVIQTLEQLGFGVERLDTSYTIKVPSFRATREFSGPEDVIEEIGRYYGYDTIEPIYAHRAMQPFSQHDVTQKLYVKRFFAYGAQFQEVATYALYDESFINSIGYNVTSQVCVQDPVSANYRRLVASLLPGIAKVVQERAKAGQQEMRFFESARVWHENGDSLIEREQLAGIIADQSGNVDFYMGKAILQRLFHMLGLPVQWKQMVESDSLWYQPYMSAQLWHEETLIGSAGIAQRALYERIAPGAAFVFELNGSFLYEYTPAVKKYRPVSRYPRIQRDISILIPRSINVKQIEQLLQKISDRVVAVELIDFFEKSDWHDKRALTFRMVLQDTTQTLTAEDADVVVQQATKELSALGADIR